jgi:hypothetical protein
MVVIRKIIDGYPEYSIGTDGTIQRCLTRRFLKPQTLANGYQIVRLTNNRLIKTLYVHRLVAHAFIPNPLRKPCIDHIDRIKTNNNVDNLRFCTYSENCYNRNRRANSKNKYKYIYPNKNGKYVVKMRIDKKLKQFGTFNTEKEAVEKSNSISLNLDIKDFLTLQVYIED